MGNISFICFAVIRTNEEIRISCFIHRNCNTHFAAIKLHSCGNEEVATRMVWSSAIEMMENSVANYCTDAQPCQGARRKIESDEEIRVERDDGLRF